MNGLTVSSSGLIFIEGLVWGIFTSFTGGSLVFYINFT